VSSNTPWFFNGVRLQWFPTDRLKIEPWLVNGWQSYGKFNTKSGIGGQVRYAPNGSLILIANQYFLGADVLGNPDRKRFHTDDSIQVKLYEDQSKPISKLASTLTVDFGCEYGGGVKCNRGSSGSLFIGFMAYLRAWFDHDRYAVTVGGGAIDNTSRYLDADGDGTADWHPDLVKSEPRISFALLVKM